jgi:cytochrome bd-type quinol oxidase subunit 2
VFVVGCALAFSFVLAMAVILYGLLFVSQPIEYQSPNDAAAWSVLNPMVLFLTGALSGVLASNGMKGKKKMTNEQMRDYAERALATAVQAGIASYMVGAGWKAAGAAAIGAGFAVVKAATKQRLAKPKVEE